MPPKARDSGSAVVCPLLSRRPAASYRAILDSGPVGIVTRVSAVAPGGSSALTWVSAYFTA